MHRKRKKKKENKQTKYVFAIEILYMKNTHKKRRNNKKTTTTTTTPTKYGNAEPNTATIRLLAEE